jgi:hypothetical protein
MTIFKTKVQRTSCFLEHLLHKINDWTQILIKFIIFHKQTIKTISFKVKGLIGWNGVRRKEAKHAHIMNIQRRQLWGEEHVGWMLESKIIGHANFLNTFIGINWTMFEFPHALLIGAILNNIKWIIKIGVMWKSQGLVPICQIKFVILLKFCNVMLWECEITTLAKENLYEMP